MVRALSWLSPDLPLGQYFYAYHPPLGFLLAKCFTWVGFSPLMSVQLLNAAASLGTFFILRATLGRCGLLARPAAVFFLYFGASLPIQLFLASSINLDVLTAGCAALTLYLSVRLCWDETLDRQARLTFATAIAVVIAASMLIKFSGLLLVTIPVLTALAHPKTSFRLVSVAGAAALVGLLLVSPYYVSRYYQQTGRFFPTNLEIFAQSEIAAARAARDSDRLSFFLNMVAPSPVHGSANTVLRDRDTMRLADVWQDVWL